jgi:hypothetical protein
VNSEPNFAAPAAGTPDSPSGAMTDEAYSTDPATEATHYQSHPAHTTQHEPNPADPASGAMTGEAYSTDPAAHTSHYAPHSTDPATDATRPQAHSASPASDAEDFESYSAAQLEVAAAELNDRVDALVRTLAGIEASATADGITVTVNLEGRLTHLALPADATSLPPRTLADRVLGLTQQAAATAHTEALAALLPVSPSFRALLQPPAAAPDHPAEPDDFSQVSTWSLPR